MWQFFKFRIREEQLKLFLSNVFLSPRLAIFLLSASVGQAPNTIFNICALIVYNTMKTSKDETRSEEEESKTKEPKKKKKKKN